MLNWSDRLVICVVLAALGACGGDDEVPGFTDDDPGAGADAAPSDPPSPDAGPARPRFQRCVGRAFTPPDVQPWKNGLGAGITTAAGAPGHAAQDVIARPGDEASLSGLFTYGAIGSALGGEDVQVFVDACGATWEDLGAVTTAGDGRATLALPVTLGPGVYETRYAVLGDQSGTTAYLWVLPAGTNLVVTDIDGTMTQSDAELFQQILDGTHVPVAYPGAVDLTLAHGARGDVVVYLTGRPTGLLQKTREWLVMLGFQPGPLHVTNSGLEVLPIDAGVGDFKKKWLQGLADQGYMLELAYGNATTDIYAYLGAGLPPEQVWIIGANAGQQGTNAVTDSWAARVGEVEALAPTTQPFAWP